MAKIRLDLRESARFFKGIICDDISEFESHMPSHAVGLSQVRRPAIVMHRVAPCVLNTWRGARLVERHVVEAVRTLGATACA